MDTTQFDNKAREALPEIIRLLDEAVARDPKFLDALCLLVRAHEDMYWYGFDPTPTRYAPRRGSAFRGGPPPTPIPGKSTWPAGCTSTIGTTTNGPGRNLPLATRTLPNNSDLYLFRAGILRREGRWDESLREHQKSIALNPRGRFTLEQLYVSYLARAGHRYDDAAHVLDSVLAMAPHDA